MYLIGLVDFNENSFKTDNLKQSVLVLRNYFIQWKTRPNLIPQLFARLLCVYHTYTTSKVIWCAEKHDDNSFLGMSEEESVYKFILLGVEVCLWNLNLASENLRKFYSWRWKSESGLFGSNYATCTQINWQTKLKFGNNRLFS